MWYICKLNAKTVKLLADRHFCGDFILWGLQQSLQIERCTIEIQESHGVICKKRLYQGCWIV